MNDSHVVEVHHGKTFSRLGSRLSWLRRAVEKFDGLSSVASRALIIAFEITCRGGLPKYIVSIHYDIILYHESGCKLCYNKGISRDMGSAAEGQDSRAPACQDSIQ